MILLPNKTAVLVLFSLKRSLRSYANFRATIVRRKTLNLKIASPQTCLIIIEAFALHKRITFLIVVEPLSPSRM